MSHVRSSGNASGIGQTAIMGVLHDGPMSLSYAQFSIVQRSVTAPTIKDAFAGSGNGLCGGS